MSGYKPLFHIHCAHGYFADGVFRSARITPTSHCARLLDRYACLFRAYPGACSVYYASGAAPLLKGFDENTPFGFTLSGSVQELAEITEVAPDAAGTSISGVAWFSNAAAAGDSMLLHAPDNPFAGGAIPLRPPPFVRPANAPGFTLLNSAGADVTRLERPVPDGRYRLIPGAGGPLDFYVTSTSDRSRWGAIEIFARGVPQPRCVLDDNGPREPAPEFTVSLQPRAAFWRYFIVSQSSKDRAYDGYRVASAFKQSRNGDVPATFKAPVRDKVLDKDAWIFESETAIPLLERPADRFEFALKTDHPTPGSGGSFKLPYAQPASARRQPGFDRAIRTYSDIFVYL